ncbi:hypothetical protein B0H14DRAFT_2565612 [Mycena olivaceomarginata]|nr:hypothetical protein B0H14DRAFT_2565612 [Mycena olivaceomarginata]
MEHQVLSSGEVKAMEKQFLEMESSVLSPASIKSTSIMKVLALIKAREDQFGPRARVLYLNWKGKGNDSRGGRQVQGQVAKPIPLKKAKAQKSETEKKINDNNATATKHKVRPTDDEIEPPKKKNKSDICTAASVVSYFLVQNWNGHQLFL